MKKSHFYEPNNQTSTQSNEPINPNTDRFYSNINDEFVTVQTAWNTSQRWIGWWRPELEAFSYTQQWKEIKFATRTDGIGTTSARFAQTVDGVALAITSQHFNTRPVVWVLPNKGRTCLHSFLYLHASIRGNTPSAKGIGIRPARQNESQPRTRPRLHQQWSPNLGRGSTPLQCSTCS